MYQNLKNTVFLEPKLPPKTFKEPALSSSGPSSATMAGPRERSALQMKQELAYKHFRKANLDIVNFADDYPVGFVTRSLWCVGDEIRV